MPTCDICQKKHAVADAPIKGARGAWGYVCQDCAYLALPGGTVLATGERFNPPPKAEGMALLDSILFGD